MLSSVSPKVACKASCLFRAEQPRHARLSESGRLCAAVPTQAERESRVRAGPLVPCGARSLLSPASRASIEAEVGGARSQEPRPDPAGPLTRRDLGGR